MMKDSEILELRDAGRTEEAFNEIVKAYSERLYWHVRSFSCSHEDTDDLIQEIFLKIWSALPSFRGESGLFTWMWRIATNEVLAFLRRSAFRSALQFKSLESTMADRIDEDPWFDGDETEKLLLKAVQRLPEKQKLVFNMRYFEDMKFSDLAEVLNMSEGGVKATYHIAEKKIRNFLNSD